MAVVHSFLHILRVHNTSYFWPLLSTFLCQNLIKLALKLIELEHFLDLASERYQMGSTALRPIPQHCACPRTQERVILHRVGPNPHAQAKK